MVDRFAFPDASWKINPFGNWVRIADYEAIEKKANDASAQLEACRSLNGSLRVDIEALRARLETVEADRAAQAERMARLEEALREWVEADDAWQGSFEDDVRIERAKDAARALSQEGSDA